MSQFGLPLSRNASRRCLFWITNSLKSIIRFTNLRRPLRRGIALFIDTILCATSVWLAFSLRLGTWTVSGLPFLKVFAVALPCWFLAALYFGVYRSMIRSMGGRTVIDISLACVALLPVMVAVFMFMTVYRVPRTIAVLQPMIFLVLLLASRAVINYVLRQDLKVRVPRGRLRVAIYGAGRAGQQLALALRHESHLDLVCYFEDDLNLIGDRVNGIRIYSAQNVGIVIANLRIDEIFLALPSVNRSRRREIVEKIKQFSISVRSLPSLGNIIDGHVSISDLKDVKVEDLLGRDPVCPDEVLLSTRITGTRVLITGAGGSIGAELCRQVFARNPSSLVLVENSEFALYSILAELQNVAKDSATVIIPELADVSNSAIVRRIMERYRPQTVFHSAAYKHVPLVEGNPVSGLRNNIFATYNCCLEAERVGVARFILISSDKAVRPTNVMGASKRVCEMIIQARAASSRDGTVFALVRFGNVLNSSGSVIPLFQTQIGNGGPVTLTHSDVSRYFMTIREAAQLVMQAGSMAEGGEVFVLDMGVSVRIIDLARTMIQLTGCTVRDENNPDGDIEIIEIGLRPGEKMYEELLIGNNPEPTSHPRIMRAHEQHLGWEELSAHLRLMKNALDEGDAASALSIVHLIVPDYNSIRHGQDTIDRSVKVFKNK